MTHQKQPRGPNQLARPSFAHVDASPGSTRTGDPAPNTSFREWLRKITSVEPTSAKLACEQVRLEEIRKLLQSLLSAHLVGMSSRDLRIYLRVISASRLTVVREMRFECFDLLCRKISEPVAVRKLREIDVLLS